MSRRLLIAALIAALTGLPAFAGGEGEGAGTSITAGTAMMGGGPLSEEGRWTTLGDYEAAVGAAITEFGEAPMLAALVSAGDLPPVEERISDEPLVVQPLERAGTFGGQLNVTMRSDDFWGPQSYMHLEELLAKARPDLVQVLPNAAKGLEAARDARSFTLYLRSGMKWSDGAPFGADDFMFWYEDVLHNEDLTPRVRSVWRPGGEVVRLRKIDDTTVHFEFSSPVPGFMHLLSDRAGTGTQKNGPFQPRHYLEQFHVDYNAKAGDLAKEEGFEEWYQLYGAKRRYSDDSYAEGLPVLDPWYAETVALDHVLITRNPYYWKIDTAGNQLPYLDHVLGQLAGSSELVAAKAISGEQDVGAGIYGGSMTIGKFPVFMQNASRNDYRVSLERTVTDPFATEVTILLNHTVEDPVLRELFNTPKFKHALSQAINRDEINDLVFQGVGTPRGAAVQAQAAYGALEYQENHIAYDPEAAGRLLDELGIAVDADGMRLRPDGSPLELIITIAGNRRASIPPTIELVVDHWADVGIKASINDAGPRSGLWDQFRANESQISVWGIDESEYFLTEVAPQWWSGGWFWARLWHQWYATDGAEGEEPPPAAKEFIEAWRAIPVTADNAERQRLGHDALANLGENLWFIGVIGPGPDVRFARNNLKNIDLDRLPHLYYAFSGAFQWYLEE